jgi:hypothetical protein
MQPTKAELNARRIANRFICDLSIWKAHMQVQRQFFERATRSAISGLWRRVVHMDGEGSGGFCETELQRIRNFSAELLKLISFSYN